MGAVISSRIAEIIDRVEEGNGLDEKVKKLADKEINRRIAKYEMIIRRFEKKYGMKFSEFKEKNMVEKLGHTWEVERDFFDWELAETELKTPPQQ